MPVFDIANAGPRARFTIRTDAGLMIVHNCGFGMGKDRFWGSCREDGLFIDRALAERSVKAYRDDNAEIPDAWRALESAAIHATAHPGQGAVVEVQRNHRGYADPIVRLTGGHGWVSCLEGKIQFYRDANFLRMRLPSGRQLSYLAPTLKDDVTPWGADCKKLMFWGFNGQKNRMEWQNLYGGRIMENACQAIARDVMLEAMLRLDDEGWALILTVHDELLSDDPVGARSLAGMIATMTREIPWAPGLPLKAEGWQGHRYRK